MGRGVRSQEFIFHTIRDVDFKRGVQEMTHVVGVTVCSESGHQLLVVMMKSDITNATSE